MQQLERYETVVIGGGQAGLAVGYHLKRQGRSFVILDRNDSVGDSWRARWDSLKLYSPASRDGLPGMDFPGRRTSYPTANEMADYLEAYAERFDLPVLTGTGVDTLTKEDGRYVASAGGRRFEAGSVVVATGVFQTTARPRLLERARPEHHAAPLECVQEPVAAPGRARPRRRREPLRLRYRLRGGVEA